MVQLNEKVNSAAIYIFVYIYISIPHRVDAYIHDICTSVPEVMNDNIICIYQVSYIMYINYILENDNVAVKSK